MYLPRLFHETDVTRAHALIDAHGFGTIVATNESGLEIAHAPFLLGEHAPLGVLRAHVARANPLAAMLEAREFPVVVIFHGPDAYVTPRWYQSPREQVPTWNYAVVHAHGVAKKIVGEAETRKLLGDLVARYEATRSSPAMTADPWSLDLLDPDFAKELCKAIVAFDVVITRLEAKFKLSQNRDPADRLGVIRGLRARAEPSDVELADLMEGGPRG